LLAVSAAFAFAGAAFAATPAATTTAAATKPHTAQQQRMIDCNKQATGLKGESAAAAAPSAKTTQQEKMKSCNADAKTKALKGAERKTFMSTCLKGGATEAAAAH